jgi:hypothetical protein
MPSDLPEVPPVHQDILDAAQQGKLIIFVGAGVSRLVGGPSWDELSDKLLAQQAEGNCLSYGDLNQLNSLDAKKKISIAIDICEENGFKTDFRRIIQPQVAESNLPKIYQDLYSIGTPFVTTNYAEGNGRWHSKERKNFFLIARGSAFECVPLLELCKRQKYITEDHYMSLREDLEALAKMLSVLIKGTDQKREQ